VFKIYNLSISNLPEQCNTEDGYLQICDHQTNATCRLCQTCRAGYSHTAISAAECHKCPPTDGAQAIIFSVVAGLIAVIALLIYLKLKSVTKNAHVKTRAIHSTLKRILLTHLQVVTMVSTLNVPWPREFLNMVSVFSAASSVSQHMSALSCEMTKGLDPVGREASLLYKQTIILVCLPPIIICFLFFYWVVASPYVRCMSCFRPLRRSEICAVCWSKRTKMPSKPKPPSRPKMLELVSDKETNVANEGKKSTKSKASKKKERRVSTADDDSEMMSTRDAWTFSMVLCFYVIYPTLVRFPFGKLKVNSFYQVSPYIVC
jgi:predicted amidophosphoribosyltransferase